MRVLLISDLAATGFGRVGRELGTRLLAKGHDVKIIGINWRGIDGELMSAVGTGKFVEQGQRLQERLDVLKDDPLIDVTIPANYGGTGDALGNGLTGPAIRGAIWKGWTPEAVIIVADPRAMWHRLVMDGGSIRDLAEQGGKILNYVPIEGAGLPLDWAMMWQHVTPVAMSKFGQQQLEELLGRPVPMVYHGVSDEFTPITPLAPGMWKGKPVLTKDAAKRAVGFGAERIILRADRFIFRKNYPAWFRCLRPIMERPDVVGIAHTAPFDDLGQGTIWELISREPGATAGGLSPNGEAVWNHPHYRITGWHDSFRGLSDGELRVLYNAADLIVSPTMAEGFGLTLAEALSCGVPVIATDYSAVPEVVGPGGIMIPIRGTITNGYAHEWALVDETLMTEAVDRVIDRPSRLRAFGEAGREHVKQFTWSAVADAFEGLISA